MQSSDDCVGAVVRVCVATMSVLLVGPACHSHSESKSPSLTGLESLGARVSPAHLRLEATDEEGNALLARLFYRLPGGDEDQPLRRLSGNGVSGNEVLLPSSKAGAQSVVVWDFAQEELGGGGVLGPTYRPGIRLIVKVPDPSGGRELELGIGNDKPEVLDLAIPAGDSSGFVPVALRIRDTSGDSVSVRTEWRRASEGEDAWTDATPFDSSFEDLESDAVGVPHSFLWNTGIDLAGQEDLVLLRFTPDDGALDANGASVGIGIPAVTAPFQIDNNEVPVLDIQGEVFVGNSDERRGIPIPFQLADHETDLVQVVFQWRRLDEVYPELPEAQGDRDAILADPARRKDLHICTPYPRYAKGNAFPVDPFSIRLPELAGRESWILASNLEGAVLELLRPTPIPLPISAEWPLNTVSMPLAVLPLGDGLSALLLDASGSSWQLSQIDLSTGLPVGAQVPLSGPGGATAATIEAEPDGRIPRAVLVAVEASGTWSIQRAVLSTGEVTEIFASEGIQWPAPVRGLASMGNGSAILTVGSSLLKLDYAAPVPARVSTVLDNLSVPWAVVRDPLCHERLYVSERDAPTKAGTGRIVAVDLNTLARLTVPVTAAPGGPRLERPEAMALERTGTRLLVEVDAPGGGRQIIGIDLGRGGEPFAIGQPISGEIDGLASGADGLRVFTVSDRSEVWVGGGIQQRREVLGYEPATGLVLLTSPLEPMPRQGQPWRMRHESRWLGLPDGRQGTFVWDARDCPGGQAFVRGVAWDHERGTTSEVGAPKTLRDGLDVTAAILGGQGITDGPVSVQLFDCDGDGDLDIVSANASGDTLTVFKQDPHGRYDTEPLRIGSVPGTDIPVSVKAADLDCDGLCDLVSSNTGDRTLAIFFGGGDPFQAPMSIPVGGIAFSVECADLDGDSDLDLICTVIETESPYADRLEVFLQVAPRAFEAEPIDLFLPVAAGPGFVGSGDLDSDGDLDILSVTQSSRLFIFFQTAPGVFDQIPLTLGDDETLGYPGSVEAADLDGDGDLDLNIADEGQGLPTLGGDVTLFFQTAPGFFESPPLDLPGPPPGIFAAFSAAADADGDGDLDLITAAGGDFNSPRQEDGITVFYQDAPGTFGPVGSMVDSSPLERPIAIAVGDIDSDGRLDVVSANSVSDRLKVLVQDGPGRFAISSIVDGFPLLDEPPTLVPADLDGDGDLDLFAGGDGAGGTGLTAFYQVTPGVFDLRFLDLPDGPFISQPDFIAPADLDGDGDLDLACSIGGFVATYFQTAVGFQIVPLGAAVTNALHVRTADMDGDGDVDIVSGNQNNTLAIFYQLGPGVFGSEPQFLSAADMRGSFFPLPVDLDGNGTVDLVSANSNSDNLTVFLQDSPGIFSPPMTLGAAGMDFVNAVAAGDLDEDGDIDLVSSNLNSRNLTIFTQIGKGRFDAVPTLLPTPPQGVPEAVQIEDLDSDGDADIVTALELGSLAVFWQQAPGVFSEDATVIGDPSTTCPNWVEAVDLDGDGDIDLATVSRAYQNLAIYWGGR